MIFIKSYFVKTTQAIDFIPIIHDVRYAIRDSQAVNGLVTIAIPAAGASLFVSDLKKDRLQESGEQFKSPERATVSLSLPFQKKELLLDPKQMIYLVDATGDGKRREFLVHILGEEPQKQQPQQGGNKR
ncbi:MAG: hypothetical protein Q8P84_04825 [Deltaproteobacteria bacterium]|nr:hypothetical protein [Deltaproteobacteria bacterium]MDZ4224787.1 hypothetical protein [bacterium]